MLNFRWICYAEKTQGEMILPFISNIRSPQSIMGSLVKTTVSNQHKTSYSNVYHVAIMPCFDKKLEASRPDFASQEYDSPEIDLVLSSNEAYEMWGLDLDLSVDHGDLMFDSALTERGYYPIKTLEGGGSGGFAHRILQHVAKKLAHSEPLNIEFKTLRNKDLCETNAQIGDQTFSFAKAYGFRNIQNIIQKIKHKRCKYDYVELMACPGGCTNGGGQIPLTDSNQLEAVNEIYDSVKCCDITEPTVEISADIDVFKTSYHAVEKTASALSTQW